MKPLHDFLFIRPQQTSNKTQGGIFIPDNAKEKPRQGVVLAVGKGRQTGETFVPTSLKPNDRVLYAPFAGTPLELHGEEILVIREQDIVGYDRDESDAKIENEKMIERLKGCTSKAVDLPRMPQGSKGMTTKDVFA